MTGETTKPTSEHGMFTKVLVIDSDPGVLNAFWTSLWREGFTVMGTTSSRQGLEILHKMLPEVLIMEVRLPGPPGIDLLRKVKAEFPTLPIVTMTTQSTSFTKAEAMREGADSYFVKPFDLNDLIEQLHHLALTYKEGAAALLLDHDDPAATPSPQKDSTEE